MFKNFVKVYFFRKLLVKPYLYNHSLFTIQYISVCFSLESKDNKSHCCGILRNCLLFVFLTLYPCLSPPTSAGAQTHRNPQRVPTPGWLQPFNPWKHQFPCWHWASEQLHTRYQCSSIDDSQWESVHVCQNMLVECCLRFYTGDKRPHWGVL